MNSKLTHKASPSPAIHDHGRHAIKQSIIMGIISILSTFFSCADKKPGMLSPAGYYLYQGKWHYYGGFSNASFEELDGADSATFEKLEKVFPENAYARDKNKAYYNGKVIAGADGQSFTRIESYLSKDHGHVFYMSAVLSDDPAHFTLVDTQVYKDSKQVYWGDRPISGDPAHFRLIGKAGGLSYYADSDGVIANSTRIPGADTASFKVLAHGYSVDKTSVFLMQGTQPEKLAGAIPGSFIVLNAYYASDAGQVFWNGRKIEGAAPATFRILNEEVHCSADDKHAYYRQKLIPHADPARFPKGKSCKYCTDTEIVFQD
jgi:hypothetical protein